MHDMRGFEIVGSGDVYSADLAAGSEPHPTVILMGQALPRVKISVKNCTCRLDALA